jgi:hypothetical protein
VNGRPAVGEGHHRFKGFMCFRAPSLRQWPPDSFPWSGEG